MCPTHPLEDTGVLTCVGFAGTARHHHHRGCGDCLEREVGHEREGSVVGALRTGLGGHELHVAAGEAAQHLVRADRVEGGEPREQQDRDLHAGDRNPGRRRGLRDYQPRVPGPPLNGPTTRDVIHPP